MEPQSTDPRVSMENTTHSGRLTDIRTPKKEEEYDDNDKKQVTLNMKAIHMLQSALGQKEYFRICTLPSAKQMWDALEIAHEGTAAIKENRINTLMIEYDLLR
ncbi:hypothetical protein K1719_023103 [Acacia pycnantha]|nr:hypothetical protein K1719_023103 [Acacia pycnantha]